jgi:hypothetical protein
LIFGKTKDGGLLGIRNLESGMLEWIEFFVNYLF